MILLFTDLDSTLIYSRRFLDDKSGVCIEVYNDRPHSFMTKKSNRLLQELCCMNNVMIIPVTTRVDYQVERLKLPKFKYLLLANGGVLLKNGIPDKEWNNKFRQYADNAKEEMERAKAMLSINLSIERVMFWNKLFVCARSKNPDKTEAWVKDTVDWSIVTVYRHKQDIYVFPKEFNKGFAISELKKKIEYDYVIAAGDSVLDFSMANEADEFITASIDYNAKNVIHSNSTIFSDELLGRVQRLAQCVG